MRVSIRSDYALRAMIELALARGSRTLQTGEIASRGSIPEAYLEQLVTALRKAGLVTSVRGPHGGHALAVHPARISAGDVVRALEGPAAVRDCLDAPESCHLSSACALKGLWQEVGSAIEGVLDGVSIEELAERHVAVKGQSMYHI